MTTASRGARPCAAVNEATSSATAGRISAAIGAPSSRRAPDSSTDPSGGRWCGQRFARLTAADALARLGRKPLDFVEEIDAAGCHLSLELGVADRREVDHHVGGGPTRCGFTEKRGDVQVARSV